MKKNALIKSYGIPNYETWFLKSHRFSAVLIGVLLYSVLGMFVTGCSVAKGTYIAEYVQANLPLSLAMVTLVYFVALFSNLIKVNKLQSEANLKFISAISQLSHEKIGEVLEIAEAQSKFKKALGVRYELMQKYFYMNRIINRERSEESDEKSEAPLSMPNKSVSEATTQDSEVTEVKSLGMGDNNFDSGLLGDEDDKLSLNKEE